MERHINESGEGSGSNPNDNVNNPLVMTLTQIAEYFKRQEARAETLEISEDVALERFQKFGPPRFNGEGGEEIAEKWIEGMEDIYKVLRYQDERKISFGEFQLEGLAKAWWRVVEERWEQEGKQRTWNAFLEEFRKKFIPLIIRERKEEEFIYLKQRTLTVTQYEIQFTKLSRYAPEMVNTDKKRKQRFLQGLKVEIQDALVTAIVETYAEIVELAQRVEDSQAKVKEFRNSRKSGPETRMKIKESSSTGRVKQFPEKSRKLPHKQYSNQGQEVDKQGKRPRQTCRYCGKPGHKKNKCWKKIGKCLRCGSLKHRIGECPMARANPKFPR